MPSLQDALLALHIQPAATKPASKPSKAIKPARPASKAKPASRAKPAPKADRSASARTGTLPRVAIGTFTGAPAVLYGEQGAHSESREPPKYDDVFPERFFTGNYTDQPRWYPFVIHATSKK